ncbi:pyridoxal-phosphate dependent enzyme [Methylobacterium durans]|uniref:Tryptophan synthase beta chain-like PALP domain-containing protein n=1 Tax=Methylobacterium durans TaxID=2202825 RepID=A0A2U8W2C9_9HYPH|nr:pyridoxal-phosphate dependent enzyme [Methylobacterium durans]AWN39791.1 hypothetical protein DK389_03625 [Methylobacterium durans]
MAGAPRPSTRSNLNPGQPRVFQRNRTHAGLAAGLKAAGRNPRLARSHTVLAPAEQAAATTLAKANATLDLVAPGTRLEPGAIDVDGAHRGADYGIPTDAMREAVRLMARTEGLLLDPVYSGKAFAGLLHDIRSGRYPAGSTVLYVMTGGVPGLFAYRGAFEDE